MSSITLPENYTSPLWPALNPSQTLYTFQDTWNFTTVWTVVFCLCAYTLAGIWVFLVFRRKRFALCAIPAFMVIGSSIGFFAGAPFAAVLAAVYQSGSIFMTTDIAVIWGALLTSILLIGALSKSTFLL